MGAASKTKTAVIATSFVGALLAGGYLLEPELIDSFGEVQAAPTAVPPAMPVTVTEIQPEPVRLWTEFTGRLAAIDSVELRPQVSGTITGIQFEEGQLVSEGDVLVVIDPRPYAAAVDEAKAKLSAARYDMELARKQRERAERLVKKGHVSHSVLDQRINEHTVAISLVNSAMAELEQAHIDLDYAHIKAPISGRVSRAEITVGNLVEAGPNAPVLTSIVTTGAIYAEFDVDERTYLRQIHAAAKAGRSATEIPVELTIDAGDLRHYTGRIHSFDNRIDPATGTIRARAIFENEDGSLLPGIFASLRLGSSEESDVILLGSDSVGTDQDRKFVYVVDDTDTVVYREVTLGATVGGARVITQGLETGERVILGGMMKVRPGMSVAPRPLDKGTAEAPTVGGAS